MRFEELSVALNSKCLTLSHLRSIFNSARFSLPPRLRRLETPLVAASKKQVINWSSSRSPPSHVWQRKPSYPPPPPRLQHDRPAGGKVSGPSPLEIFYIRFLERKKVSLARAC